MPDGQPGPPDYRYWAVIDAEAKAGIENHIQAMRAKGRKVFQAVCGECR
ncbi:hypothetical protein ACLK2H_05975 [Escherichia coli]